jgi:photosystem II stability/assembly factor-like uncharacterized protein
MRSFCEIFILVLFIDGCNEAKKIDPDVRLPFTGVALDTLYTSAMSVRAITLESDKVWYATDKGTYGFCSYDGSANYTGKLKQDTIPLHFRGIAQNRKKIFIASTEKPAVLYSFLKSDPKKVTKVYEDTHPNAFFNGIQFWNESEVILFGDPLDEFLNIVITRDGGQTWKKVSAHKLPKLDKGEYAFAASNTSLAVKEEQAWIVTGGTKARVLYTPDKGESWEILPTPMIAGAQMTGIYSVDFYNDQFGIMTGGDYENQTNNSKNKALTIDGGKSWVLIADKEAFGYASCIQFVPQSGGTMTVALGPSGIYSSNDSGLSWLKLSAINDLHTFKFVNKKVAIAAGKNKIIRLRFTTD